MTAMYFIIYYPTERRLQLLRTPFHMTVREVRRLLNVPPSVAQIHPTNQRKFEYIKECLK